MSNNEHPLEHVISYAYPTSDDAVSHGHAKTGCYILKAPGISKAHKSLDLAILAAKALGTVPGRWSFDHPQFKVPTRQELHEFAAAELTLFGWVVCRGSAIAKKVYKTAVGNKEAQVYLHSGFPDYNYSLSGDFLSEGHNCLEAHCVLIPSDVRVFELKRYVNEFAEKADAAVDQTYARGLFLKHGESVTA